MRMLGRKEKIKEEETIGRFFQPREGNKIAIILVATLGIALFFILGGFYLFPCLPYSFPPSLFIALWVFLGGLSSGAALSTLKEAKIGDWVLITKEGIARRKRFVPWEKIKGVIYWQTGIAGLELTSLARPYILIPGIHLLTISPEDLREQLKKKGRLQTLFQLIRANSFVLPLEIEDLPQLVELILPFVPRAIQDMESFLVSQLAREDSLLGSSSDFFQARIYPGRSALSFLHNFFMGIRHLMKLNLAEAEKHLKEAYKEGEARARPFLCLSLFLQGKYEECASLLSRDVSLPQNKGERLMLLSSLVRLGRWEDIKQRLKGEEENYQRLFQLGTLCAFGEWGELISEGERMLKRGADPALSLCLGCAKKLKSQRVGSLVSLSPPAPAKWHWKQQLVYLIGVAVGVLVSLLEGWTKGFFGGFLLMIIWLLEWLPRRYLEKLEKEMYVHWMFLLHQKFASPFWCSLAFLPPMEK